MDATRAGLAAPGLVALDAVTSLLSSNWYRVSALKPRLRPHVRLARHRYRGELWFVLRDPMGNRTHRFTPTARLLIAAMNGQRSVEQLWTMANRQLGERAPTQDEVIQLLGQLHSADLLQSDVSPDASEAFERGEQQRRKKSRSTWANPLALRIHLWNPDAWLNRHAGLIRRVWSPAGAWLWLALVLPALLLLPAHWGELTENLSDRLLATDNLLMLWLVFPVLKLLHEMGHAVAVKRGGGEVTDMGVLMLVLIPVPYVDASASSIFKSKWERAAVGAAGMGVELLIAALAFYGWLLVEPGLLRSMLFNLMAVAGLSTLIFNGNPLLRYDAYYMLVDWLEMPNLAQRATRWWLYQLERWGFGNSDATPPRASRREAVWMALYGVGTTVYRVVVAVAIALFVAGQFFFVGVALGIWALVSMTLVPVFQMAKQLAGPALAERSKRVWAVCLGTLAALWGLLFLVPAPDHSTADAVVWLPERAEVRASQDGLVDVVQATPGSTVKTGDLLFKLHDAGLWALREQSLARVAELQAAWAAQFAADRSGSALLQEQLERERQALARHEERLADLQVRAQTDGVFVLPHEQDLVGRHVKRGTVVAHVLQASEPVVRVVVPQAAVGLVRQSQTRVMMRLAHQPARVLEGRIVREVPQAEFELPSATLSTYGGGSMVIDPKDPQGRRTLERNFQFDLALPPSVRPAGYGERVHVRFEHAPLPLGQQAWRAIRRLLLSHFQV